MPSQHQKQRGGYRFEASTPSKSSKRSTKRRRDNPLHNPEQLHKIMSLLQ